MTMNLSPKGNGEIIRFGERSRFIFSRKTESNDTCKTEVEINESYIGNDREVYLLGGKKTLGYISVFFFFFFSDLYSLSRCVCMCV